MDTHGADIDSLPYIDKEYDSPEVREKVLSLIQEEMGRMPPPPVPRSAALFKNNELLRKEYERVKLGRPLPQFDIERYKLETPKEADSGNVEVWKRASDNAASQLEHQSIRLANLELLQHFGANAWKLNNYQKEQLLSSVEKATSRYKEEGVNVNKARKYEQTEAGIKLAGLESRWSEGVRQCIEIQVANCGLRDDINKLEQDLASESQQQ